jgi:predicted transposase YbfD/YdcC
MRYTPKKTVRQIISRENDYVIAVKANQAKLLEYLKTQFEQIPPLSVNIQIEQCRDRYTQRKVSVLDTIAGVEPSWVGIQRMIRVERAGTRANQPFTETMFSISSLAFDPLGFAQLIRAHWQIENRLHWIKDAILDEDRSPLCNGHAPVNFAIVRTIALNLFRYNGFDSIAKGLHHLAHDVSRLFSFLQ